MPIIRQLDPHVADLIAAGEVVERPASVVKELMENAIDAGASHITVEIAGGGMALIRVTDDGCGIPPDQAATAFLRHATSKITGEYDLEAIGTLGFRGEALAAIAAVSRVELLTRTAGAPLGTSLLLEGGVVTAQEEAGCPAGTTMVVRDLFFNTPARLKFMKRDQAEGAAVFGVVQREALAHPEIAVKFLRDGKQDLSTPGDGQVKSAMYAVFGRDIALGFLPVRGTGEEGMEAAGFASMPTCCRGSRTYQHFFVNGRYVKSALMQAAVEEAYKNQKMVGKFPGCVLHLTCKPSLVDVNVHPTKTEVKFASERQVFSAVYHAVLSALERGTDRPAALPAERPAPKASSQPAGVVTLPLHTPAVSPAAAPPRAAPVSPPPPPGRLSRTAGQFRPVTRAVSITPPEDDFDPSPAPPMGAAHQENKPAPPTPAPRPPEPVPVSPTPAPRPPEPVPERPAPAPVSPELVPDPAEETPWVIRGELFRTYIVVEQGETALLIDKHAAHERMNFDRLRAAGYRPMCQQLLTPVSLRLSPEEKAVLLANLPLLEEFGFEVEEFGGASLLVRQAPDDVAQGQIEDTLCGLARRLLTTGTADPAAVRDELLHTMACKAAIKGGWKSAAEELEAVAAAVLSGQVKHCPHGRPVAIELSKKQLEKQFRRA